MRIQNKLLLLSLVLWQILSASLTYANVEKINAGVVSNIWYSSMDVYSGNSIKIFGAIYNRSSVSFSGVASFIIDDVLQSKTNFTSKPDSLIEIDSLWNVVSGNHSIQLKISEISYDRLNNSSSTLDIGSLLSSESSKVTLYVSKKISVEDIKENTTKIYTESISYIDSITDKISNEIEKLKILSPEDRNALTSTTTKINNLVTKNDERGQVLGTTTENISNISENTGWKSNKYIVYVYNKMIDFLSLIVKYWKISLIVIFILFVVFRFLI